MLLTGVLYDHLSEIDDAAQNRYDTLMCEMQTSRSITEALKVVNPLAWATRMNGLADAVREIVTKELIY